MPRLETTSRIDRIPGLYEHIKASWQREVLRGDPTLILYDDLTDAERDEFNKSSPHIAQAKHMVERMTRGESTVIARWEIGAQFRQQVRRIAWLLDPWSGVRAVTVAADDVVSPAE